MNLITPAKRKQAAALVKEGFSVSLAADADTEIAILAADHPQYVSPSEVVGAVHDFASDNYVSEFGLARRSYGYRE